MEARELRIDVSAAADVGEAVEIAATLFLPDGKWTELLVAIHGGGYSRKYWHPQFRDFPGYSFAEHVTATGKALLTIDMLGMGESSAPEPESKLSRMKIAAACDTAVRKVVADLGGDFSITGIGHSMGGLMAITIQAAHTTFDRLAVLGWTNAPMQLGDTDIAEMMAAIPAYGYLPSPRKPLRALCFLPDVPMDLIEADEAQRSLSPSCLGRDALTPGIVHAATASIICPVFIQHGAVDTSPDPHAEAAYFRSSPSVTVFVLEGSAHCHNFATTRLAGWQALDDWIAHG
jgi:pimeloyl-ACP methyl ester carboxylesterase